MANREGWDGMLWCRLSFSAIPSREHLHFIIPSECEGFDGSGVRWLLWNTRWENEFLWDYPRKEVLYYVSVRSFTSFRMTQDDVQDDKNKTRMTENTQEDIESSYHLHMAAKKKNTSISCFSQFSRKFWIHQSENWRAITSTKIIIVSSATCGFHWWASAFLPSE